MFNAAMAEANRLSVFVGMPGRSLWQGLVLGGMCVLGGWSISVAAAEEGDSGKPAASGQEAHLEQALRAKGWDVSRDDDGSLVLRWTGGGTATVEQEAVAANAGEAGGAGGNLSAQQASPLEQALRTQGWNISRDDDGSLILRWVGDVDAVGEEKTVTGETKGLEEAQVPTSPVMAGGSQQEAAALLQTINLLRNDGWQVQEDGEGGLFVYPSAEAKPVKRVVARVGVGSEPLPDRDGDGVADALDLCPESAAGERVDKAGCPAGKALQLQNVTFQSGSSQLTDVAKRELSLHAEVLLQQPELRLSVLGHTDSRGDAAVNQRLSQLRAESVKQYLLAQGLSESLVEAEGRGETQPIADNATVEGRRRNRRVELLIHDSH